MFFFSQKLDTKDLEQELDLISGHSHEQIMSIACSAPAEIRS